MAGLSAGSRSKTELLQRLVGQALPDPTFILEDAAAGDDGASHAAAAPAGPPPGPGLLEDGALACLDWVALPSEALQQLAGGASRSYSCCPLPAVRCPGPPADPAALPAAALPGAAVSTAPAAAAAVAAESAAPAAIEQPAAPREQAAAAPAEDSDLTVASQDRPGWHPPPSKHTALGSPSVVDQPPPAEPPAGPPQETAPSKLGVAGCASGAPAAAAAGAESPAWLVQDLRDIARFSQASAEAVAPEALVGRKVRGGRSPPTRLLCME